MRKVVNKAFRSLANGVAKAAPGKPWRRGVAAVMLAAALLAAWAPAVWAWDPENDCVFPWWCPWRGWSLCWAYADCNWGTGGGLPNRLRPVYGFLREPAGGESRQLRGSLLGHGHGGV